MPRLIDADIFYDNIVEGTDLGAEDNVDEALKRYLDLEPTVEAIPKADYEARLKADMVAMLEDLDLKIDEMYEPQFSKEGMDGFYWAQGLFKALVQEEINALKGNTEQEKNNEQNQRYSLGIDPGREKTTARGVK